MRSGELVVRNGDGCVQKLETWTVDRPAGHAFERGRRASRVIVNELSRLEMQRILLAALAYRRRPRMDPRRQIDRGCRQHDEGHLGRQHLDHLLRMRRRVAWLRRLCLTTTPRVLRTHSSWRRTWSRGGNSAESLADRGRAVGGLLAIVAGLLAEHQLAPFVADTSLTYFLVHVLDLQPVTLLLIGMGGLIGFWVPFRRRIRRAA
jgi:hypothetical protein